jgi:enoyl-[acyl-carrier protein] reductase III
VSNTDSESTVPPAARGGAGGGLRPPGGAAGQWLEGKSVLVTGGSRGIGRETALRFADAGAARVAIGYLRNDRAAEETAEQIRARGAEPTLVRGNVASDRIAREVAELGPLDVLVHNAATGVIRPALETEDKHWDWTLAANARALLSLTRGVAPSMPEGSSIVAISSLGAQRVLENYILVGTSKAALEAVVRYLGVELAPRGIRVNAVSGGVVETGALAHFPNREEMLRASRERTPAGRMVEPSDIADAVLFLASPQASMIVGQTLVVDGGFSLPA